MAFAYLSRLTGQSKLVNSGVAPAMVTSLLDTQSKKVGSGFQATIADTITAVAYYQSTIANTPAAASYRIGIQTLSATTGLPTGTWLGATNNGFVDIQPVAGDNGKYVWSTLGETVTLAQGDQLAIVMDRLEATNANTVTVGYGATYFNGSERVSFPYSATHNATSWTRPATNYPKLMMRGTYYHGDPFTAWYTSATFGTTTEVGCIFTLPSSITGTYKLAGARFQMVSPSSGTGTVTMTLYSNPLTGSITVLDQTSALDADLFASAGNLRESELMFTTSTALTAGTKYAVGFSASTAALAGMYYNSLTASADKGGLNLFQQTYGTRTLTDYPPSGNDTNNFTETATQYPVVELVFQDMTTSAGSSGMLYVPNLDGV